jgi:hypothetical protein
MHDLFAHDYDDITAYAGILDITYDIWLIANLVCLDAPDYIVTIRDLVDWSFDQKIGAINASELQLPWFSIHGR